MSTTMQTLCYLFRDAPSGGHEVLLGRKLRGFGAGKIMGLGGHVEADESPSDAAAREVQEESGLVVVASELSHRAALTYRFPEEPQWDATVDVFVASRWVGTPVVSDEIEPVWYPVRSLPLGEMWDDEPYWLPRVLAGDQLVAEFTFDGSATRVALVDLRITKSSS